jgi:hypothetical protein
MPLARQAVEEVLVGGVEVPKGLLFGVWITNTKTRRAKLTPEQRRVLADLGLGWAA